MRRSTNTVAHPVWAVQDWQKTHRLFAWRGIDTTMTQGILNAVLILLTASVFAVAVFRRLRLPSILAYLLVGVIIGPHGLALIPHTDDTHFLAEFGIVFLLFTIGLEFSMVRLASMKTEVLGLGGAQVMVSAIFFGGFTWLIGFPLESALILGGVLAVSSTAIVIKQLKDQQELGLPHGRLSVAILLFQDLAVVPFLILVPVLSGSLQTSLAWELVWALGKGLMVIGLMLAIGWWVLRPLFGVIVSSRSAELFTLTALFFAMSAAWLSHFAGLSFALGAFLAGMILGETEFRHQIEADIRPFRDVLLGLFFVTIGMMLDIHALPGMAHWVLLLVVVLIVFKTVSITGLSILLGAPVGVSMRTGVVLSQGGEFGLALLAIALTDGLIDPYLAQIVLAAIIFSMALTPILINYNGMITKRLCAYSCSSDVKEIGKSMPATTIDLSEHVIIGGYGQIGRNLAQLVQQQGFDFVGLDLDATRVRDARKSGERVEYGDASHRAILEAAGLSRAKVLIFTYGDVYAAEKSIVHARMVCPNLPILVWTEDDASTERLLSVGATGVIPRNRESLLMLESSLLHFLDVPLDDIVARIQSAWATRYPMSDGFIKQ